MNLPVRPSNRDMTKTYWVTLLLASAGRGHQCYNEHGHTDVITTVVSELWDAYISSRNCISKFQWYRVKLSNKYLPPFLPGPQIELLVACSPFLQDVNDALLGMAISIKSNPVSGTSA
jgi:hypothetical protein